MARRLEVEIIGDARSLNRALNSSQSTTRGFAKNLGNLGKTAVGVAGAAGIGALIFSLKTGVDEYQQNQKEAAILNAVLKSTGHAANVTAKHVTDLSESLMKKTGIDDEAIQTGQNLLLTFTNIRNEAGKGNQIFDEATKTITDLSVALGQDFKQSAMQVGKALQDPTRGLTALRRVGVAFTEDQMKLIKHLDASGHKLEAQKMILRELNKEFGGAAEAVGKTLPGQLAIARESFNNFAGDLVAKSIPYIERFISFIRDNWPKVSATIKQNWEQTIRPALAAMSAFVIQVVSTIKSHWNTIGPVVRAIAGVIRAQVQIITAALRIVTSLLRGDWQGAWNAAKSYVSGFVNYVRAELALLKSIVTAALRGALAALKALGGLFLSGGKALGLAIIHGMVSALSGLASAIKSAIESAIRSAVSSVHIPTPHISTSHGIPTGIHFKAAGGPVGAGKPYIVGEKGPEMFVPGSSGSIVPNRRLGGGLMQVNLQVDSKTLASILIDPLRQEARIVSQRTGRPAFG